MNFMKIDPCDMNNGSGLRVTLFVSGCSHGCEGCFNKEAWDYRAGILFNPTAMVTLLRMCGQEGISGLSILGGEPLAKKNAPIVLDILARHKEKYPEQDRWVWTGYTLEQALENPWSSSISECVDCLIDGKYDATKPTKEPWRGSDNQRLWHCGSGVWTQIN